MKYDKDYYLGLIQNIVGTYSWWGIDLTSMLNNIENTDYDAYCAFNNIFTKKDNTFELEEISSRKLFYERLAKMLLDAKRYYVNLNVEPLDKEYSNYKVNDVFYQENYDYALALLLLTQEFLFQRMSNNVISYYDNKLFAKSDNLVVYLNKNSKKDQLLSEIIIPNRVICRYDSYLEGPKKIRKQ